MPAHRTSLPAPDFFDRSRLIAAAGETVLYESVPYVVDQVGLKYYLAHLESNPKVRALLKRTQVSKPFPLEQMEPYTEPRQPLPLVPKR